MGGNNTQPAPCPLPKPPHSNGEVWDPFYLSNSTKFLINIHVCEHQETHPASCMGANFQDLSSRDLDDRHCLPWGCNGSTSHPLSVKSDTNTNYPINANNNPVREALLLLFSGRNQRAEKSINLLRRLLRTKQSWE